MRKLVVFLMSLSLLSCNTTPTKSIEETITVSIRPQKYMVEQIAGDHFNINVLVADGSGPETYEPSAKQMKEVSESKTYFMTGLLDFEKGWLQKVAELHPNLKIVNTASGVDLIEGDPHHEHSHGDAHHHHHDAGVDPHIWLSIREIKVQSNTILKELIRLMPELETEFAGNHATFNSRLDSLDAVIADKFTSLGQQPVFMIYHPALGYFARDYGLRQLPIELGGKEPSPSYMKELIDMAKENKINTIFYSEQFDIKSAQTLSDQLGLELVAFNPLEENIEQNLLTFTDRVISSTVK